MPELEACGTCRWSCPEAQVLAWSPGEGQQAGSGLPVLCTCSGPNRIPWEMILRFPGETSPSSSKSLWQGAHSKLTCHTSAPFAGQCLRSLGKARGGAASLHF